MKNQPRRVSQKANRLEWLRNKMEQFSEQRPPGRTNDLPPEPPRGYSSEAPEGEPGWDVPFGFLGLDEGPMQGPIQDRRPGPSKGTRNTREEETQAREQHPWPEEMLGWDGPPPPREPSSWNHERPRHTPENEKQANENAPRSREDWTDPLHEQPKNTKPQTEALPSRHKSEGEWEELPALFDETETVGKAKVRQRRENAGYRRGNNRRRRRR
ncbi:hypothetical protein [Salinithrix halophila]|uniref:Uncharacterized protein n=1 Tax=Salinithrix halophila TaxID=1485204 RepID=A0ABV8JDQ2_9BACL